MNDHAAVFKLRTKAKTTTWYKGKNLKVWVADPHYLLGMKLVSGRFGPEHSDLDDVALLMKICGFGTAEELTNYAHEMDRKGVSVKPVPEHLEWFCEQAADLYNQKYK